MLMKLKTFINQIIKIQRYIIIMPKKGGANLNKNISLSNANNVANNANTRENFGYNYTASNSFDQYASAL